MVWRYRSRKEGNTGGHDQAVYALVSAFSLVSFLLCIQHYNSADKEAEQWSVMGYSH